MANIIGKWIGSGTELVLTKPKLGMDEAMKRYAEYIAKKNAEAASREIAEMSTQTSLMKQALGQSDLAASRLSPIGSGSVDWAAKTISRDIAKSGDATIVNATEISMRNGARTLKMSDAFVQKSLKLNMSKQMKRSFKQMNMKLKRLAANNPRAAAVLTYGTGATAVTEGAYLLWKYFDEKENDPHQNGDLITWLTDNVKRGEDRRSGAAISIDNDNDSFSTDEKELILLLSLLPSHIRNWLSANLDNDYLIYAKPDSDLTIYATNKDCDFQDVVEAVRDLSFMFGTEIKDFVDKGDFIASKEGMYIVGPAADSAKFHYGVQHTVIPFLTHTYLVTGGQTGEHLDYIRGKAKNLYFDLMSEFRLTGNVECELLARTVYNYL